MTRVNTGVSLRTRVLAWGIRTRGIKATINLVADRVITPIATLGAKAVGKEYTAGSYRLAAGHYLCFPKAHNEHVEAPRITDPVENKVFNQEEVPISSYSHALKRQFDVLRMLMGNGSCDNPERGFLVFLMNNGSIKIGEIIPNEKTDGISAEKIDAALENLSRNTNINHISRLQMYHTHPSASSARLISRMDVGEAIRLRKKLQSLGITVPVDMHALPFEMIIGKIVNLQPPPLYSRKTPPPEIIEFSPRLLRVVVETD